MTTMVLVVVSWGRGGSGYCNPKYSDQQNYHWAKKRTTNAVTISIYIILIHCVMTYVYVPPYACVCSKIHIIVRSMDIFWVSIIWYIMLYLYTYKPDI